MLLTTFTSLALNHAALSVHGSLHREHDSVEASLHCSTSAPDLLVAAATTRVEHVENIKKIVIKTMRYEMLC